MNAIYSSNLKTAILVFSDLRGRASPLGPPRQHERDEEGFGIAVGNTYSHSFGYVETATRSAGMRIIAIERGAMRMERKHPLPTMFLVIGKS